MVLEEIYNRLGLKSRPIFFLVSGFIYAFLGVGIASLIFPGAIGLVAVFLISMALMPLIGRLISLEELLLGKKEVVKRKGVPIHFVEFRPKGKLTVKSIIEDHKDLITAYTFSFLGVFFAFAVITSFLPFTPEQLFGEQFTFLAGGATAEGQGLSGFDFFLSLIQNNLSVLIINFLLALIFLYGDAFVIVWNASIWGTIFAFQTRSFIAASSFDPVFSFLILLVMVFPHLIAEALCYFSAAVAGGLASNALAQERGFTDRMAEVMLHSLIILGFSFIMLLVAAALEVFVPSYFAGLFFPAGIA